MTDTANPVPYLKYSSYLPFGAAILAVTFDLGSFFAIGLGHFSLFGLSEHFLFAIESIPYLILLSLVYLMLVPVLGRFLPKEFRDTQYVFLFVFYIAPIAASELLAGHKLVALFAIAAIVTLIGVELISKQGSDAPLKMLNFAIGLIVLTFIMGYKIEKSIFDQATDRYEVKLKDGTLLQGELLKSGERGILFFTPSTKEIQFRRWDSLELIKRTTADLT